MTACQNILKLHLNIIWIGPNHLQLSNWQGIGNDFSWHWSGLVSISSLSIGISEGPINWSPKSIQCIDNVDDIATYARMLPALAFVPTADVKQVFDLLVAELPSDLEELVDYFEFNGRQGRLPLEKWNQYERVMNSLPQFSGELAFSNPFCPQLL